MPIRRYVTIQNITDTAQTAHDRDLPGGELKVDALEVTKIPAQTYSRIWRTSWFKQVPDSEYVGCCNRWRGTQNNPCGFAKKGSQMMCAEKRVKFSLKDYK